jgi:chromosome segregation ATPase
MNQLSNLAQAHHGTITQQLDELNELHTVTNAQVDLLAQRDVIINNQENQIHERETVIAQRNTIIEFLQDQVQDLTIELDDAVNHINDLYEQPAPFLEPEESESEEEEEPEEIEGESGLDSEHGDPAPNPQSNHSSSGRVSSVGNLDDF